MFSIIVSAGMSRHVEYAALSANTMPPMLVASAGGVSVHCLGTRNSGKWNRTACPYIAFEPAHSRACDDCVELAQTCFQAVENHTFQQLVAAVSKVIHVTRRNALALREKSVDLMQKISRPGRHLCPPACTLIAAFHLYSSKWVSPPGAVRPGRP